ncbi:MAG: ABC transporter ATP-binding protein [Blastocatellia bacterium]|nr:ABC transporter ATP-binding protein [Blastocatellia bacterium]
MNEIVFDNVSKFYGEILGVNKVNLTIAPGITSFVGSNGAGKTTLMNLMTGLLRPTRGKITVLGTATDNPEELFRKVGYCSQFDSFPARVTGRRLIDSFLSLHGYSKNRREEMTNKALERVNLLEAADRKVAGYSKGMRQRIRLAQSIAHSPSVLILDEPLNGLDPMVRAETIALFKQLAKEGLHLIISSHILHEVDMISDRVVFLKNGYLVAEGEVQGVRTEIENRPMQILVRCNQASKLVAKLFELNRIVEAKLQKDRGAEVGSVIIRTYDADAFYRDLSQIVVDSSIAVEVIRPMDDDLNAVYQYLIGSEGEGQS